MTEHGFQTFGSSDNGKPARLASGGAFVVELAENPTTGFRWAIRDCPPQIEVTSDEFIPPSNVRPGAGGIRRWTFRAGQPGDGTLTIELLARGNRGGGDRPTFTLAIEVLPR